MLWSWTPVRSFEPELMDAPGLPESEVAEAYQVLRRVNRQLGNLRSLNRELQRFLDEEPRDGQVPVSILDVGSGSGDLPQALRARLERQQVPNHVLGLDRDPTAVALAGHQSPTQAIDIIQGDALRLPFADGSIDLVTAVKFAHHFHAEALTRLLAEMARVAGRRVIVLDIQRHWLAYWGFIAWSRLLTRNRLVRYDGPLSVLRGFTADELTNLGHRLPAFTWTVRTYAGFQLALVGRRITSR
ncbi:methyltransferase domain-containing protein [Singulisphaera sp. Ch08]|uniref:Methyltransferase domain-containing protein n=1 Tax=Singulisphaera sp. Ch08 TaxID=3120278 RepID=A0AAU7C9D5_9BACT